MLRFNLGSVNALYGRAGAQPCTSILRNMNTIRSFSSGSSTTTTSNNISRSSVMSSSTQSSSSYSRFSRSSSAALLPIAPRCQQSYRTNTFTNLVDKVTGGKGKGDVELQSLIYDKESVHYTGKIFGVSTDTLFFYTKVAAVGLTVYLVVWTFFAGYNYLMSFSLAAVGRLGFMAGFWTCFIVTNIVGQLKKRYTISPNAVYNQAIAMALKDPYVKEFLGEYPKTGDFRAYHASGGFKLPLMRRIRSGSYELADLLGTKPQRLQMMFILKSPGREALVSCDVRKMHTRLFTSSYHFKSLAVHLKDTKKDTSESKILLGRDEDIIYKGIMKF